MPHALTRHPDFTSAPVTRLEAEAARGPGGRLTLRYRLAGAMEDLLLPARAAPGRADELWRHTCFEAFLRDTDGEGYFELNFSPSTQWAAYRFDGYRRGMAPEDAGGAVVGARTTSGGLELHATVNLPLREDVAWRIGLSAVIEAADGGLSYWALAHPAGRPDFHHPAGFALTLPATTARTSA